MYQGMIGLVAFYALAWLISEKRRHVQLKPIIVGLATQAVLAASILKISLVRQPFLWLGKGIEAIKAATLKGTSFVYGYLGGGDLPFNVKEGANTFVFIFQALPMIMVVGALSMLLFYWRVLPVIVQGFSWILRKTMNIGGALGVCAAAKVFLGQSEAPLLIRPYLRDFSRSELFTVMTCGMATTSGTIMALYATILENTIPNAISHILTASIISIPAAITVSRVMVPHIKEETSGELVMPYRFSNWMDAVFRGTSDGMQMVLSIASMLVVVIALVALTNSLLGTLPLIKGEPITLERIFGLLMAPITWLMGVPWSEAFAAGNLLGTKTVINEVIAFLEMAKLPEGALSSHSNLIMMYGLCGFANFSSIGIAVAAISSIVPERRDEIISLGFKCVISGTLCTCLSGTIIGLLTQLPF